MKQDLKFDVGLPLKTFDEFEQFYIDYHHEQSIRFKTWLLDKNADAIIITGQIGTGKTSFIKKHLLESSILPIVQLKIDKIFKLSSGSLYGILLGQLMQFALKNKIEISQYGFDAIYKKFNLTLESFVNLLTIKTFNIEKLIQQDELFEWINSNFEIIKGVINEFCKNIETKILQKIFITVEGIDKYELNSPEYKLICFFLSFLSKYKTMYETNIVHTLSENEWNRGVTKIMITNTNERVIQEILEKRAYKYKNIISKIVHLSGGNPRQAIRLFIEFEFAKNDLEKNDSNAIEYAVNQLRKSMFVFENANWQLLNTINKDNYITQGTLIYEEVKGKSIFRNIILLKGEADESGNIPAVVNPLFMNALREHYSSPSKDEYSIEESEYKFNLTQALQYLAIFFFDKNANEIIIIAFDNIETAKIINSFLIGSAGSYREIEFTENNLTENNFNILFETDSIEKGKCNSVFFDFELDIDKIRKMDRMRENLIDKNMIWWINQSYLENYLNKWTHLRQFIKILDLKENILKYLKIRTIENDLDNLEFLNYSEPQKEKIKEKLFFVMQSIENNE